MIRSDLAEVFIADLSYDASFWRHWGVVSQGDQPIRLFFRFSDTPPSYARASLHEITRCLKEPYVAEGGRAAQLVGVRSENDADVIITLSEEIRDGEAWLKSELCSQSYEVFGIDYDLVDDQE